MSAGATIKPRKVAFVKFCFIPDNDKLPGSMILSEKMVSFFIAGFPFNMPIEDLFEECGCHTMEELEEILKERGFQKIVL